MFGVVPCLGLTILCCLIRCIYNCVKRRREEKIKNEKAGLKKVTDDDLKKYNEQRKIEKTATKEMKETAFKKDDDNEPEDILKDA